MKENVEHQVEEEEGEMFKKARQLFDQTELDALVPNWKPASKA